MYSTGMQLRILIDYILEWLDERVKEDYDCVMLVSKSYDEEYRKSQRLQLDRRRLEKRPPLNSTIASRVRILRRRAHLVVLLLLLLLLVQRRRDNVCCCSAFTACTRQSPTRRKERTRFLPKAPVTVASVARILSRKSAAVEPIPAFGRLHASFRRDNTEDTETDTNRPSENPIQNEESIPPDVQFSLAILFLSQFVLFIGVGAVIPAIPLYGQEIGLSQAANGIVISAPAVALLLLAKFTGNYADRARKPAMLYGMACIALADFGTAVSTTLLQLLLARLGLGLGRGVAEAGERGMLADLVSRVPQLRGRAVATQQAVIALGIAIGAPCGGIVIEQWGVRAAFLCVTAGALVALVLYTLLPETVVSVDNKNDNDNRAELQDEKQREVWSTLWKDRRWRGLALAQCGTSFGFAAKIATIPVLATAILPGGAAGTGLLISAAGLSGLVGAPIGGWLTDRFGARRTAALSGTVSATGFLFIPVALNFGDSISSINSLLPSSWGLANNALAESSTLSGPAAAFCALVVLWSLGATAQGPALTAYAQELAPLGSEATALALPRAAGDGTYILAPLLLGAVADTWTEWTGIECAFAGLAILIGSIFMELTRDTE